MAAKKQINFLPEDYLEKRRQQRTNILCLVLFAVVMLGLIVAFLLDEKRTANASTRLEDVNQRTATVAGELVRIEQMERNKLRMIHKADVTASLLERRPRSYLLAEITNALPRGASLQSFDLSSKLEQTATSVVRGTRGRRTSRAAQPQSEQDNQPPKVIESVRVLGLAPNDKVVSQFLSNLNDSLLFVDVNLIHSEEHQYNEETVRRFMIMMQLNPAVEVTPEMARQQRIKKEAFSHD